MSMDKHELITLLNELDNRLSTSYDHAPYQYVPTRLGSKNSIFFAGARMADRISHLFQEWHRLGGAVLLAKTGRIEAIRSPEEVIAESTAYCRHSGRLTWVVLDWLIDHIEHINPEKLVQETGKRGDMSVLGVLCDAAHHWKPHPKFHQIMGGLHSPRQRGNILSSSRTESTGHTLNPGKCSGPISPVELSMQRTTLLKE